MIDIPTLLSRPQPQPFPHWAALNVLPQEIVRTINAQWPDSSDSGWTHEKGKRSTKSAFLFPRALPSYAAAVASECYSANSLALLSEALGIPLEPDPWFTEGPLTPQLGGGLHEIHEGGKLNMHVDFEDHPSGLRRVANLLIYLNLSTWQKDWGGYLTLSKGPGQPKAMYPPEGGSAVLFETSPFSWHGHPEPLTPPKGITRRSLALYYYTKEPRSGKTRPTTIYQDKIPPEFQSTYK